MKLKELKNEEFNLLDFITFFDDIADTKPYFTELTFKYGERPILSKVENLFLDSGLGGIGMAFDLMSNDWKDLEMLSSKLVDDGTTETTTTKTKDTLDTSEKTGVTMSDTIDDDFVVPYDDNNDVKQGSSTKTDNNETTENLKNIGQGTDKTVSSGYDKERMNYTMNLFMNYPNYRLEIYNCIVDSLCVKGYN